MAALRAFIGGLLGLIIGAIGVGTLSDIIMGWAGVSDFEGGRGMAAAFFWAPLGAITGLCLGIWLGLRWGRKGRLKAHAAAHAAAQAPAAPASLDDHAAASAPAPASPAAPLPPLREHNLRNAVIAIGGIIGLGALIFWIQYASTPQHLNYDGANANLAYELRMPAALADGLDRETIEMMLDTDLNQQPGFWIDQPAQVEGDWRIYAGEVEMYYRTSERLLVFRLPNGRDLIFNPDMGSKPDPDDGWSEWRPVDFIGENDAPQAMKPKPEDRFEMRYRVRVWGMD